MTTIYVILPIYCRFVSIDSHFTDCFNSKLSNEFKWVQETFNSNYLSHLEPKPLKQGFHSKSVGTFTALSTCQTCICVETWNL